MAGVLQLRLVGIHDEFKHVYRLGVGAFKLGLDTGVSPVCFVKNYEEGFIDTAASGRIMEDDSHVTYQTYYDRSLRKPTGCTALPGR